LKRATEKHLEEVFAGKPPAGVLPRALFPLWALFLGGAFAISLGFWIPQLAPPGWAHAALAVLALALVLAALGQILPPQNLVAISLIMLATARIFVGPGSLSGADWQPNSARERLFPWLYAAAASAAMLGARGTARLLLRSLRASDKYGFYLLGLAVILCASFGLGFQPFTAGLSDFRPGAPPPEAASWHSLLGWIVGSGLAMLLATPFLIIKRPVPTKDSVQPFAVWIIMNLLAATYAIAHQFWAPAVAMLAANLLGPALGVLLPKRPKDPG
jgi:hypothetical protein